MMEKPERQPYIHWTTCYDYRGDVDYRRVFLHIRVEIRQNKKSVGKKRPNRTILGG